MKKHLFFGIFVGAIMLNVTGCWIPYEVDTAVVEQECEVYNAALSDYCAEHEIPYSLNPKTYNFKNGDCTVVVSANFTSDQTVYNFGVWLDYYPGGTLDVRVEHSVYDLKEWDDFAKQIFAFLIQTYGSDKVADRACGKIEALTEEKEIRITSKSYLKQYVLENGSPTYIEFHERKKY